MKIRFLEIAQIELDEAIEYYNLKSPGYRKPDHWKDRVKRSQE